MSKQLKNPVIVEGFMPKWHCLICQKPVEGFYGAWGSTGTCSAKCERVQEKIPRFPTTEQVNAMR